MRTESDRQESHRADALTRVFFSTPEQPGRLRPATPEDPIACVWDLSVIAHEREAWIRYMLAKPSGADAEGYLADAFSGDV